MIYFTRKKKIPPNITLTLFGTIIDLCNEATLLGCTLDKEKSLKNHVDKLIVKTKQRMSLIRRLKGTSWGASSQCILNIYKSFIRPILEYGSMLTADCCESRLKQLQTEQNKAIRFALGTPKHINTETIHQTAGIEPIKTRLISLKEKALKRYEGSELMRDLETELALLL